jgi:regulator of replication initiation timing
LNPIGQAELQKEIQRTVKKISDRKEIASITSETETSIELDEKELKKYLHHVIEEVKKRD